MCILTRNPGRGEGYHLGDLKNTIAHPAGKRNNGGLRGPLLPAEKDRLSVITVPHDI